MYFGSLGLPLPLGVIIIIPGKLLERIPESVCARAQVCGEAPLQLWVSSSSALQPLGTRFPPSGAGVTLACGDSA